MLTLQAINANPEEVIAKLAKKHFDAEQPIRRVIELDKQRRAAQAERDNQAAQLNKMAAQIGGLMKQGKKDEAEAINQRLWSNPRQGHRREFFSRRESQGCRR